MTACGWAFEPCFTETIYGKAPILHRPGLFQHPLKLAFPMKLARLHQGRGATAPTYDKTPWA